MYISKVSLVNYRNFENSYFLSNKQTDILKMKIKSK